MIEESNEDYVRLEQCRDGVLGSLCEINGMDILGYESIDPGVYKIDCFCEDDDEGEVIVGVDDYSYLFGEGFDGFLVI